jgi:hypothetical protein
LSEQQDKNAAVKGNPQGNSIYLKCHITGGGIDSSFFELHTKKKMGQPVKLAAKVNTLQLLSCQKKRTAYNAIMIL